jgi:endonuclease YncB( thermonuclease family)
MLRHLTTSKLLILTLAALNLTGALCGFTATARQSDVILGRVIKVTDGDSIVIIDRSHNQHHVRLSGIDAPELGQAFGRAAKTSLANLIKGKEARIEPSGLDRYGRVLGKVWLGTIDVNLQQVRSGYAWFFRRYAGQMTQRDRLEYDEAEVLAKSGRLGLWQDPKPVPPWDYRHPDRVMTPLQPSSQSGLSSSSVIIGNRRSGAYHRPDCPSYQSVSLNNRILFASEKDARLAGYHLAKSCPTVE